MRYRTLGRTGLQISVVGLGGHWRTPEGKRYCDRFDVRDVPAEVVRERAAVVSLCLDEGVNYLDVTTEAECLVYGRVLAGRRDRVILGADDYQWSARNPECLNLRSMVANVERCLARLQTDYLDIWRVISEVHGRNTARDLEVIAEAAECLRRSGKIRFLGLSGHDAAWMSRALGACDAIDAALMPCPPCPSGTKWVDSPFATAERLHIGTIGIKPFAGGLLFDSTDETGKAGLARAVLQRLVHERRDVACVVPGLTTVEEARVAIAAATAPPLSDEEARRLDAELADRLKALPRDYQWLAAWQARSRVTGTVTVQSTA